MSVINYGEILTIANGVFQTFSGIAVSIASNIMTIVIFFIVKKGNFPVLFQKKYVVLSIIIIPSALVTVIYLFGYFYSSQLLKFERQIYFLFRLVSICINFVVCSLAVVYTRRMMRTGQNSKQMILMCSLVGKMQYYPLVQAVSRSGLAMYEIAYGWDFDPEEPSPVQFACQIFYTVIEPVASVGYLVIFLILQPKAWNHLLDCFYCHKKSLDTFNVFSETISSEVEQQYEESFLSPDSPRTSSFLMAQLPDVS